MAVPTKSTTVRTIQSVLRLVARISPRSAARIASSLFFMAPPRHALTAAQQEVWSTADHAERLETDAGPVQIWTWGRGPRVVLQHGWGGWAAQLHAFVQPLVDAGFQVVAVDSPGHGASPGRSSSFPAMAAALRAIADQGPVHAVVAHSLGCCGAVFALETGLEVQRFVGIGGPAHPLRWFDEWVGAVVDDAAVRAERDRLGASFGWRMEQMDSAEIAKKRMEPMLWVHDTKDKEVAFSSGEEMVSAWPGAKLLRTEGLGHRRILVDPGVIDSVVEFVHAPI